MCSQPTTYVLFKIKTHIILFFFFFFGGLGLLGVGVSVFTETFLYRFVKVMTNALTCKNLDYELLWKFVQKQVKVPWNQTIYVRGMPYMPYLIPSL